MNEVVWLNGRDVEHFILSEYARIVAINISLA